MNPFLHKYYINARKDFVLLFVALFSCDH